MTKNNFIWIPILLAAGLIYAALSGTFAGAGARASAASAQSGSQPEETPVMMSTSTRLTPPPTVYPPTQADSGAQIYFYRCMVCHGDRGQGLTEEWRNVLGPPDNNCWQSRCHGPRFGADGFQLPKQVPPVILKGILAGFGNAQKLFDFLKAKMPWQQPGALTDEQYWQLTAFLVRANGYDLGKEPLSEKNAAAISFAQAPSPPPVQVPIFYIIIGSAVVLCALILLAGWLRQRAGKKS